MPKPGGALVRVSIAAERLGLCVATVKQWIRKKKISGVRIAGRWYVHRPALDKLTETQNEIES